MNKRQVKILIGIAICVIVTFIYPPHASITNNSVFDIGFSFIWDIPDYQTVYVNLLLAEWLGIGIVGGICFILARNTEKGQDN